MRQYTVLELFGPAERLAMGGAVLRDRGYRPRRYMLDSETGRSFFDLASEFNRTDGGVAIDPRSIFPILLSSPIGHWPSLAQRRKSWSRAGTVMALGPTDSAHFPTAYAAKHDWGPASFRLRLCPAH